MGGTTCGVLPNRHDVEHEMKAPRRDRRDVAAAVCHRRNGDTVELLIVRTKGGKRWTFPKGHVKAGETLCEAAAREAREEAGVEGDPAFEPFTYYRYPGTRDKEGESLVAACLLRVTREHAPDHKERRREPTWVAPHEAVRLLATGGREPGYADEHARVVREAIAALSARR